MSRRDPLFCLQKGGRFAPVVLVICSLQKGGHFAAVVVGRFAAVVIDPNCCPIQEGGRFAALVWICGSQMSKKDPLFCLQKGSRFAPVVVVICSLQKGGRFAAVVVDPNCCPIQEGGRFAALVGICGSRIVQKIPIILPSKRRPLRARGCCYLSNNCDLIPGDVSCPLRPKS